MTGVSDRMGDLLDKFSRRLEVVGFTSEGIPSEEEVDLIKDIWSSLTEDERARICENVRREISHSSSVMEFNRPDVTPYAMRLTFKYFKMVNSELS
ncbi:MAG: hypothetical protein ABIH11_00065 [Candidatus Altiarchaeota archaeon]